MSGNATVAVWRYRDDTLTAIDRYVLLALADEADSAGYVDGRSRRTPTHLANKTHLARKTIDRTMKRLTGAGLVVVVTAPVRGGKGGGAPGDFYLPMVDAEWSHSPNGSGERLDTQSDSNGPTVQTDGDRASYRENPGFSPGTSDVPPDVALATPTHLANMLADLIEANGSRRPPVTKAWVTEIDRMIRLDERSPELIEKAIRWCQQDSFWRGNILSPAKLRSKFDQLRLASIREKQRSNGNGRALDPVGDLMTMTFDEEGAYVP